ncbi:MAG: hypothetical protein HQL54_01370 [Magnetococcales bacterium]|nr:hypothetical protein [Magnetococcales bacterium]
MTNARTKIAISLMALTLSGCVAPGELSQAMGFGPRTMPRQPPPQVMQAPPPQARAAEDVDLIRVSHSMADALIGELRKNHPSFHRHKPILVTSFVNRSDLNSSSDLGLMLSDQVASRFSQQGYTIVEARLRPDLAIRERQGEFILSRDIEKLSQEYKAYAVIVGKYTRGRDKIYLDTQLIQVRNRQVLASINAKLPIGDDTRDFLVDNGGPSMTLVNQ